jgi:hypothetical protein
MFCTQGHSYGKQLVLVNFLLVTRPGKVVIGSMGIGGRLKTNLLKSVKTEDGLFF